MRALYSLFLLTIPIVLSAQADSVHADKQSDSLYRDFMQQMRNAGLVNLREMHLVIGVKDATLRTAIENRLRSNGIPFVTRYIEALHQSGDPTLYVDVIKLDAGTNVYRARVALKERVTPVRFSALRPLSAVTWSRETFVQDDGSQRRARAALLHAVDEFVNAYKAANGKR